MATRLAICYKLGTMLELLRLWLGALYRVFCTRRSLLLENLALRQQLAVPKRKHPRPKLGPLDKLFWIVVWGFWSQWKDPLVLVLPETVVRWHRRAFARYWTRKSRRRPGRPGLPAAIRDLIQQMCQANFLWGAPRIHGELLKLGIEVAPSTVGHRNAVAIPASRSHRRRSQHQTYRALQPPQTVPGAHTS